MSVFDYVTIAVFLVVLPGILMASQAAPYSSTIALIGLAIFFAGGLLAAANP